MSVPPQNLPFGPGFDEQSATNYATELARRCDELHAAADYIVDTYSPFSADEIAAYWASVSNPPSDTPTAEQTEKANEFKSWIATVQTMIDTAFTGDVGYQIKRWRNAGPYPGLR
jgi:hypothetical protein